MKKQILNAALLAKGLGYATALSAAMLVGSTAEATTVFSENFEGDLSAWTGKLDGPHHGVIVADPYNSGNHVLNFTALNSAGDIFTSATFTGNLYLSFDYLGTCTSGNCGGFVGSSSGFPDSHTWLAGTGSGYPDLLADTGNWVHISNMLFSVATQHLMLEQFESSTGPIGTAYFDNITITTTPTPIPAAAWLFGSAMLGLLGSARRKAGTSAATA